MSWSRHRLVIGHATDVAGGTGCTVVRGESQPFRCGVALAGRASGTRELATCDPAHLVDTTDAILLTGGSAFGLDATAGVMQWMEERRRGYPIADGVVPIVPAAVIFDLAPIGRFDARPTPQMAYDACASATADVSEGAVGAGTGALVGKALGIHHAMKGGVGVAHASFGELHVSALAVVNAFGDVRDGNGAILAGARDSNGVFLDSARAMREGGSSSRLENADAEATAGNDAQPYHHTTLAVIAVSVPIDKLALSQVAHAATAALFQRVAPSGTSYDGDVIFCISPAETPSVHVPLSQIEAAATHTFAAAIERGVRMSPTVQGFHGLAS